MKSSVIAHINGIDISTLFDEELDGGKVAIVSSTDQGSLAHDVALLDVGTFFEEETAAS
jgi:hypothetical protein